MTTIKTRQAVVISVSAFLLFFLCAAVYLQAAGNRGPDEYPIVVTTRNMGAGERLLPEDLTTVSRPVNAVPDHVLVPADLETLRTRNLVLGTPRLAGEYIHASHLNEAIRLRASERGIMLSVDAVSGLAGLLRPGDLVGVVAVVHVQDRRDQVETYSKILFEDLRVLYISPEFQRTLVQAAEPVMTEEEKEAARGGSSGVVMVAASLLPTPLVYERQETLAHEGWERLASGLPDNDPRRDRPNPYGDLPPTAVWMNQVELLTMLQAAEAAFVLYRQPPTDVRIFSTTPGSSIAQLLLPIQLSQTELIELYDLALPDAEGE